MVGTGEVLFVPKGDWSWGRSTQNDFRLPNETISRQHLRTWWLDSNWWCEDLGSTNGTFVNSQLLNSRIELQGETLLQMGKIPIVLTPWDHDDVLPRQVARPPLVLDLGEATHSLKQNEREQMQTEQSFFDTFMSMENPTDFYQSDLPGLFRKMGITGYGVSCRGRKEPLLLFSHGEPPQEWMSDRRFIMDAFSRPLQSESNAESGHWISHPLEFRRKQLFFYVISQNGNYKDGLPPFLYTRLAHLARLIYLVGQQPKRNPPQEDLFPGDRVHENEGIVHIPQVDGPILIPSSQSREMVSRLMKIAPESGGVIIEGETGVGKEIAAAMIHHYSGRKGPFLPVMTSSISEHLVENELFGHKRGSFSGATSNEKGKFATADGGTIFLDEVADMPPMVQAKLLRVLENGEVYPIGDHQPVKVNVRVLAASNITFDELIQSGRLRLDLYYRLNTYYIRIPPLRDRREEILPLFELFLSQTTEKKRKTLRGISPKAMRLLLNYPWPGNVRELKNEAKRVALRIKSSGVVHGETLNEEIRAGDRRGREVKDSHDLRGRVEQLERDMIRRALEETGGHRTRTAEKLGISRRGLSKKMGRLGIE